MAINLAKDFISINNVLNQNLSRFTTLRIIGFNQGDNNRRYYATSLITTGFFYKAFKNPKTGQVLETVKLVPLDDNIDSLFKNNIAKMLELGDKDGNFLRFSFETEKEPNPPSFQWIFTVKPNKEDIDPII